MLIKTALLVFSDLQLFFIILIYFDTIFNFHPVTLANYKLDESEIIL